MDRHPIESLMGTTMENIKDMVDVNTVIGDPVRTDDGSTIIPISRVSFGFVAGGGEYGLESCKGGAAQGGASAGTGATNTAAQENLPFAGGSGAGVSVQPMGFLVVGNGQVKLLSANYITPIDRVMELLPQVIGDLKQVLADSSEGACKKKDDPFKCNTSSGAYQSAPTSNTPGSNNSGSSNSYPNGSAGFDPPTYTL